MGQPQDQFGDPICPACDEPVESPYGVALEDGIIVHFLCLEEGTIDDAA